MPDTTLRILTSERGSRSVDRDMKTLEATMRQMGLTGVDALKAIESVAADAGEGIQGHNLKMKAAIGLSRRMRDEMKDLNKETIFARAQLNNKKFLATLRRNELALQKLGQAAEPLRDRIDRVFERGNALAGTFGLVGAAGEKAMAAIESAKASAVLADIGREAERLGTSLEKLRDKGGGLGSKEEVAGVFRAAQLEDNAIILNKVINDLDVLQAAALRAGISTEDLVKGLSEELKDGKAGDAFKTLGSDAEILEVRMQRLIEQGGRFGKFAVGADRVSQAYLLMNEGLSDADRANRQFADQTVKAMKRTENSVKDYMGAWSSGAGSLLGQALGNATDRSNKLAEASARVTAQVQRFAKTGVINFDGARAQEAAAILEAAAKRSEADGAAISGNITEAERERLGVLLSIKREGAEALNNLGQSHDLLKLANNLRDIGVIKEREKFAEQLKQLDAELAQEAGLTRQEKITKEIQRGIVAQQLAAASLSTTVEDIPARFLEVMIDNVRARFVDARQAAEDIAPALEQATTIGAKLAAVGQGIGGALRGGVFNLFGASPGEKKAPPKTGGGGGAKEDFTDLINRAELIGMSEDMRALTEATREWEKELARVGDNVEALDAANAIFADKTAQVFKAQGEKLKQAGEQLGAILTSALQAPLQAFGAASDRVISNEDAKLDKLADKIKELQAETATAARVSALAGPGGDAGIAERMDALLQEREQLLAIEGATNAQRLTVQREFGARIRELEDEARIARFDANLEFLETQTGMQEQAAEMSLQLAEQEFQRQELTKDGLETTSKAWIEYGNSTQQGMFTALSAIQGGIKAGRDFARQSIQSAKMVAQGQRSSTAAIVGGVGGALAAGGQVAAGLVKNEKAKAIILAASNAALALQEAAFGNFAGAALHTAAALQFGLLANISTPSTSGAGAGGSTSGAFDRASGLGGGGGGGGGANFNAAPSLAPRLPQNAERIVVVQLINRVNVSAETQLEVLNDGARGGGIGSFDGSLIPTNTGSRQDFLPPR